MEDCGRAWPRDKLAQMWVVSHTPKSSHQDDDEFPHFEPLHCLLDDVCCAEYAKALACNKTTKVSLDDRRNVRQLSLSCL